MNSPFNSQKLEKSLSARPQRGGCTRISRQLGAGATVPEFRCTRILTASIAALLGAQAANAANVTWIGTSGSDWNTSGNPPWIGGSKPGSSDTAVFNTALASVANGVADQTVGSISFDTNAGTASGSFTIGATGGNKLTLANSGTISILATMTGTGKTIVINSPLVLTPASVSTAGSYTFANFNTNASNTLNFAGAISSSLTTGTETLTLGGVNMGNNTISGAISSGAATTFALTQNAGSNWLFTGNNTYNGATTVTGITQDGYGNQTAAAVMQVSGAGGKIASTSALTVGNGALFVDGDVSVASNNNGVTNRINSAATLTLNGGAFRLAAADVGGAHSQALATLTVGAGSLSAINANAGTGTNTLTVSGAGSGNYVHNTGGALNIDTTQAGFSVVFTNAPSSTNGVAGSGADAMLMGATLSNADFIAANAGTVGAATYTLTGTTTWTAGKNMDVTGSNGSAYAPANVNSLRFNANAGNTVALASGTSAIAGGILVTGTVGANPSLITGAAISGASGKDLVVFQNNSSGLLQIASTIVNNGSATGLTKAGAGILTLSSANSYTGTSYIYGGTLKMSGAGTLGASGSPLTMAGGTLDLNATSQTVGSFAGTGGTITNNGGGTSTLTIGAVNTGGTFDAIIADGSGTISLSKVGTGTVILGGTNAYTGNTTLYAGTIQANYTPTLVPVFSSSTSLVFSGGNLTLQGVSSMTPTQTFNGVTASSGAATITINRGGSGNWAGAFGAISRSTGATINIAGTVNNSTWSTTSGTTASGILGGYITWKGTDWAAKDANQKILPPTNYTNTFVNNTTNTDMTASLAVGSANATTGSVRFNSAGAYTLTLNGSNTIASGGILVGSGVGANTSTITGGSSLTSGNGQDLIVNQFNTGALIIGTNITGAIALTKSGSSTAALILNGNNTFTGGVIVNSGSLQIGNAGALNSTPSSENAVSFGPSSTGNLSLGGYSVVIANLSSNATLGAPMVQNANASAATLTVGNAANLSGAFAGTIQDGAGGGALSLTKAGAGTLTLTASNTYTGTTTLASGTLNLGSAESAGAGGPLGKSIAANPGSIVLNGGYLQYSAANHNDYSGRFGPAANQQYNVDTNGQAVTWASALTSSGGSLTKIGAGTLTLTGSNSYTGVTTINAGTLQFGKEVSLYSNTPSSWTAANLSVAGGATVTFNVGGSGEFTSDDMTALLGNIDGAVNNNGLRAGSTIVFDTTNAAGGTFILPSAIADTTGPGGGAVGLIKTGSGALVLTAAINNSGGVTINNGILQIGASGTTGALGITSVTDNGTLLFNRTDAYGGPIGNSISGTGAVTFSAGSLTLTGSRSYSGGTTLSGGNLAVDNNNALGAGPLVFTAGTLQAANGDITLSNASTLTALTVSGTHNLMLSGGMAGASGGSRTLTNNIGSGQTLTLGAIGINQDTTTVYSLTIAGTGNTTVAGSISDGNTSKANSLVITNSGLTILTASNSYSGTTTVTGGTLQLGTGVLGQDGSIAGNIANNATLAFNTAGSGTWAGVLSGTGTLVKAGGGALALAGTNSAFTGAIAVQSGTLAGTLPYWAFGIYSPVTISPGATLALPYGNENVGSLSGSGGTVSLGGYQLFVGVINTSSTFGGVISDSGGSLYKQGTGTQTLTGANNYTGVTTLAGGILNLGSPEIVGVSGPLGASAASNPGSIVFSSGTLQYSAANNSDYSGRFSTAASQAFNIDTNGRNVTFATALSGSGGSLAKFGAGTLTLTGSNSYTGATTISAGTLQVGDGVTDGLISGSGAIVDNGTLGLNISGSQTYAQVISGPGSVVKTGTGTLTLTQGAQTFSGGLYIKQGTVGTSNGNYTIAFGTGPIYLGDSSGSVNATLSLATSGNGNSLGNPIYIQAGTTGTLTLLASGGSVTINGNVALSNNLSIFNNYPSRTITLSGIITGSNAITITGQNLYSSVVFSGPNGGAFTGNVSINSGMLSFANHSLGDGSGTVTLGGGILGFAAGNTQDISSRLRASGGSTLLINSGSNALVFGTPLTDPSLTGGLSLGNGGSLTLTGSNTYTGTTSVGSNLGNTNLSSAGTLILASSGATIKSGNALTTGTGGTFDINGNSQVLGLLNNSGTVTNSGGGTPTLTIGNGSTGAGVITGTMDIVWNQAATSSTLSGVIATTGNVTLNGTGAGTMTLAGSNTYSGNTTVTAGAAYVNGTNGALVNTGTITVTNGASLFVGDTSNALADRINDNATLVLGAGNFTLTGKNSTATAETIGALNIAAGGASVVSAISGTGSTAALTINSLTRSGTGATVAFAGTGAVLLPNLVPVNGIVGGFAAMGAGGNNVTGAPATVVGGTVTALTAFDITYSATTSGVTGWSSSQNILIDSTNATVTLAASATANSLTLRTLSGASTLNLGGNPLTLSSGGIFWPVSGSAHSSSISSGTLTAGNGSAPAELFITSYEGNNSTVSTISSGISDNNGQPVSVVKGGDYRNNAVLLTGTNSYSGGTYLNGGPLAINRDANLGAATGAVYFQSNSSATATYPVELQVRTTGTLNASRSLVSAGSAVTLDTYYGAAAGYVVTVAGQVTGSVGFAKRGDSESGNYGVCDSGPLAGTVILTNTANNWSGSTTVSAGILQVGDGSTTNGSIPDRAVSFTGANTTLKFANPSAFTFNSAINGTGALVKTGAGTLTLGGSNSYLNGTTISQGTLAIGSDASLGAAYDGSVSGATVTNIGGGYATGYWNLTFSAPPHGVTATGSTTSAYVVNTNGQLLKVYGVTGGSGYIAPPTVSVNGSGSNGAIQAFVKGLVTLDGGTLQTTAGITSSRAVYITGNNGTIDTDGFNSTFSGAISGPGELTKSGAGTLILGGSLSMAGLNANSGVTQITQSGSIGAVSVAAAATLSMAAHSGTNYNVLNVSSLTISGFSSSLASADSATYTAAAAATQMNTGVLTDKGIEMAQAAVATGDVAPASPESVPEPGSLGLLLAGAAGLLGFRRKAKKGVQ